MPQKNISTNNSSMIVLNRKINDPEDHTSHHLKDVCTNPDKMRLTITLRPILLKDIDLVHSNVPNGIILNTINRITILRLLLSASIS